jgi:hypothetical protein
MDRNLTALNALRASGLEKKASFRGDHSYSSPFGRKGSLDHTPVSSISAAGANASIPISSLDKNDVAAHGNAPVPRDASTGIFSTILPDPLTAEQGTAEGSALPASEQPLESATVRTSTPPRPARRSPSSSPVPVSVSVPRSGSPGSDGGSLQRAADRISQQSLYGASDAVGEGIAVYGDGCESTKLPSGVTNQIAVLVPPNVLLPSSASLEEQHVHDEQRTLQDLPQLAPQAPQPASVFSVERMRAALREQAGAKGDGDDAGDAASVSDTSSVASKVKGRRSSIFGAVLSVVKTKKRASTRSSMVQFSIAEEYSR